MTFWRDFTRKSLLPFDFAPYDDKTVGVAGMQSPDRNFLNIAIKGEWYERNQR